MQSESLFDPFGYSVNEAVITDQRFPRKSLLVSLDDSPQRRVDGAKVRIQGTARSFSINDLAQDLVNLRLIGWCPRLPRSPFEILENIRIQLDRDMHFDVARLESGGRYYLLDVASAPDFLPCKMALCPERIDGFILLLHRLESLSAWLGGR